MRCILKFKNLETGSFFELENDNITENPDGRNLFSLDGVLLPYLFVFGSVPTGLADRVEHIGRIGTLSRWKDFERIENVQYLGFEVKE